ncbi:MAG: porin family protein [Bacteriovoracaceae bacterium]|jgi:opacity protein-like surface antigen|nr:porin family protein [Bacteriovoracaceae bacterium]
MKSLFYKLMATTVMSFLFLQISFANEADNQRKIHKHSAGIGLGQTFLLGNFESKGDNKITLDFLYTYTASFSFDLLLNLHSSAHTHNDKEVKLRGAAMGIKSRVYEFDSFSPYLLGGLGFYAPTVVENGKTSERKVTFGFNFGGGLDLRLNDMFSVGLMGQFHHPFKIKQDEAGVKDVSGSYFKLLMTLMYQF